MFIPLTSLIPREMVPAPFDQVADLIAVSDFSVTPLQKGFQLSLEIGATSEDLTVDVGGDFGITLVFRQLAKIFFSLGDEIEVRVGISELVCRLPAFLHPATYENGKWIPDTDERQQILFKSQNSGLQMVWNSNDGFSIHWPLDAGGNVDIPAINLSETMIGDSGVVISADAVDLLMDLEDPILSIQRAVIHLPDTIPHLPDLVFDHCTISRQGFNGTVNVVWGDLTFDEASGTFNGSVVGKLFGLTGGLDRFSLEFRENMPVASDIQGGFLVPYFDKPVMVQLVLGMAGNFSVTLRSADQEEIMLIREELLALTIHRLTVDYDHEHMAAVLIVSGGLEPLLMAFDGLEWPRLDVTDLSITQDLSDLTKPPVLKFKEAWLDLSELKPLDLWGFKFELSRVGLGFEDARDRLWVDLSGGVRLLPQIPVGLGVEGFRLSWPRDLGALFQEYQGLALVQEIGKTLEVKFDGVYLFYGVPKAVEFEGFIRFIKEAQKVGFAGDMMLRVPATGFSAEAGLMIGMNFETPPYPFLYVYLGVELPKGIPLGQSGLALKGALGLFGLNVSPDKAPEQNWYYDWYKRGPIVGAHPTNKWRDERDALALGVGVTITTVDGYIKGTRGLLVLALPGPILVIEGRALIFDGLLPAEPPLRALAIFNGSQKTVQFNIEAEAELVEDMLMAYAMLEAFFDFEDLTNWHLYLGQDQPADRRVRANIFKFQNRFLFDANAYLMLDMIGQGTLRSRMGVFVDFRPQIPPFGPVTVDLNGTVEGSGLVTVLPEQFSGEVKLAANAEVRAFGFGVQFAADAEVLSEGPNPFTVDAELRVTVEPPWPFDPFETTLHFEWESPSTPEIQPPLIGAVADSNFTPGGGGLQLVDQDHLSDQDRREHAEASPVVPIDARPTLAFSHDMADGTEGGFRRHPDGLIKPYAVGPMSFTPTLMAVRLYEHTKDRNWGDDQDWTLIGSTKTSDIDGDNKVKPLWGTWLADAAPEDPSAPAVRRLRLWTDDPFVHARYAESFLAAYPDYRACQDDEPREMCVDFTECTGKPPEAGKPWTCQDLAFDMSKTIEIKTLGDNACLVLQGNHHHIRFPKPVRWVRIRFCEKPGVSARNALQRTLARRPAQKAAEVETLIREAEAKGEQPDFTACIHQVPHRLSTADQAWTIETDEGFQCLEFVRIDELMIQDICYRTEEELARAARAKQQCKINAYPFPMKLLQPGCYYRLKVTTTLEAALPLSANSVKGILYKNAFDDLPEFGPVDAENPQRRHRKFAHETFFQTEGPPTNLARYLKWSTPAPQDTRVFRGDDVAIRFLRSNMSEMYGSEAHQLRILLRDAQGRIVNHYETEWHQAASATLLPEEQTWLSHRRAIGIPDSPIAPDDVLEARLKTDAPPLAPKARYEALVTGGEGGVLLFKDDFASDALEPAWRPAAGWSVREGQLRPPSGGGTIFAGDEKWTDVDFTVEVQEENEAEIGIVFRHQDDRNGNRKYYRFSMGPAGMALERIDSNGAARLWKNSSSTYPPGQWLRLRVAVIADQVRIWLFHKLVLDVNLREAPERSEADAADADPHSGGEVLYQGGIGLYSNSNRTRFRRLRVREAVLYRVPFTTSAFESFKDLVCSASMDGSFVGPAIVVGAAEGDTTAINDYTSASAELALQLWNWQRAQVDFRDEEIDREVFENRRLTLREAKAAHDEAFRSVCESLVKGLYYHPFAPELEDYGLELASGQLAGFWIRSPESLDLQLPVDGRYVGRTSLKLEKLEDEHSDAGMPMPCQILHDSDSTQVLLLAPAGQALSKGQYRLTLTYVRNHGDETTTEDHRYDRPVERRQGRIEDEVVSVWVVA